MDEDCDSEPRESAKSRKRKSLHLLTRRFVKLIQEAKEGVLDLKQAATILTVDQKRRIYDITNVLHGIGMIVKVSKSHVRWIGEPTEAEAARQLQRLKSEVENLEEMEFTLDQQTQWVEQSIQDTQDNHSQLTYVNHEDVCSCYSGHTLLVVRAPSGTCVDVPIPKASLDSAVTYQVYMRSSWGPIHVRLLHRPQDQAAPVVLPFPPSEEALHEAKVASAAGAAAGQSGRRSPSGQRDASWTDAPSNRLDSPLLQSLSKELRDRLESSEEVRTSADILTKLVSSRGFSSLLHPPALQSGGDGGQTVEDGEAPP